VSAISITRSRAHDAAVEIADADVLAARVVVLLGRSDALQEVLGVAGLLVHVDDDHRGAVRGVAARDHARVVAAPALAEARLELLCDRVERRAVAPDDLVATRRRPDHVARPDRLGPLRARPGGRRVSHTLGLAAPSTGQARERRRHDRRCEPASVHGGPVAS